MYGIVAFGQPIMGLTAAEPYPAGNIQRKKIQLVQTFLKLQSEQAISRLEKMLQKEAQIAEHEEYRPMSIKAFNKRIDQSMQDSQSG